MPAHGRQVEPTSTAAAARVRSRRRGRASACALAAVLALGTAAGSALGGPKGEGQTAGERQPAQADSGNLTPPPAAKAGVAPIFEFPPSSDRTRIKRIDATVAPIEQRAPLDVVTLPVPFGTAPARSSARTATPSPAPFVLAPLMVERGNGWATVAGNEAGAETPETETAEELAARAAQEAAARRSVAAARAARERARAARAARLEAARRRREKSYAEYFRGD